MSGKHSIRRHRGWPRRLLITANVFVALAIVCTASAYGYVRYQLGQVQRVLHVPGLARVGDNSPGSQSEQSKGVSAPPFTMLIIGSDTRNLGSGSNAAYGNQAQDPGQRSDSIILVRVVPDAHTLALFSIPRDTVVPVPGYGTTRINAAFNTGSPSLLVRVLHQDFDIQVNHVAQFNFATFEDIANAIGGVYQYFPAPAKDAYSDLNVRKAGCVLLNGATALAFARSREYQYSLNDGLTWPYQQFPESDLGRIQRQQDFVKLAAKKAQSIAPTNPLALNRLISSLTKDVKFDTGFSNSLILELVKDFRSAGLANIASYTYPTTNTPGATTLTPDTALGKQMIQQWLDVGQVTTLSKPASTTTVKTAPRATPTTKAPAPTTTIAPGSVAIEVVNGSGKPGQASLATGQVHAAGYLATNGGNGSFGHAQTVIDYAPDSLADAKQLQHQLSGGATLTENPSLASAPYNLQLITGENYRGIGSSRSTATSSTTAAPTTTTTIAPETNAAIVGSATVQADSSSFYKGRYIPPGREPGQIPSTCPT